MVTWGLFCSNYFIERRAQDLTAFPPEVRLRVVASTGTTLVSWKSPNGGAWEQKTLLLQTKRVSRAGQAAPSPRAPIVQPLGDRIEEVGLCLKPVGEKKPRLRVSGGARKPKPPSAPPRNIRHLVLSGGSKHNGCGVCMVLPRPALAPSVRTKCSIYTVQSLPTSAAGDLLKYSISLHKAVKGLDIITVHRGLEISPTASFVLKLNTSQFTISDN